MFRVFLGQNNWKIDGIGDNCADLKLELPQVYEFDIKEPMSFIAITTRGAILASAETEKPTGGSGQFKIAVIMAMEDEKDGHNNKLLAFCRNDQKCNQHDGKVHRNVPFTLPRCEENTYTLWCEENTYHMECSLHITQGVEGTHTQCSLHTTHGVEGT